jgi:hypothetical protein
VELEEMRLVKGNQDIGETYVYVLGHSSSSAFRIHVKIVTTAGPIWGAGGGGESGGGGRGGEGRHARPAARRHLIVKIVQRFVGGGADQRLQNP